MRPLHKGGKEVNVRCMLRARVRPFAFDRKDVNEYRILETGVRPLLGDEVFECILHILT